ncbi:MAG: hypothetical protein CL388_04170 [Acidiferrobacteraceae bacterium]|jgi:hypothetical protein|nr:hypothetical protein [Acidiferrobacteraceae bacterium]|tara:strand:+ start:1280 stop:1594 length:315 start_codon:yes stop_codon:yes gene_type:complete
MKAGFAFARVDVRGSGDSEGVLSDEYAEVEIADGVQIIDWLAIQPWCDGNVGMRRISLAGNQHVARGRAAAPALKAIPPIAGSDERYSDDAHFIGGIPAMANSD